MSGEIFLWVRAYEGGAWVTLYQGWDYPSATASAAAAISRDEYVILDSQVAGNPQWEPRVVWNTPHPQGPVSNYTWDSGLAVEGSGGVCNPAANPPLPSFAAPIGSRLTPAMRAECVKRADDMGVPIGTVERMTIDGVPVVLVTNCHSYTVGPSGAKTYGAYHGCSVWLDKGGSGDLAQGPEKTDWKSVALSGAAITLVVTGFWMALKTTGRIARV